ncbi:MAG TPA: hypothetical protein VND22_08520 [Actinomycetota bacterium]|nr:hypothetical protein [Actinomycetota bacterium]
MSAEGNSLGAANGDLTGQSRKMSRVEAGRKGGMSTRRRYGKNHFSEIGRIGGKKGGDTTKQRHGTEFFKQIGKKGGSR